MLHRRCRTLKIEASTKTLAVDNIVLHEGDYISLNGSKGYVYNGRIDMIKAAEENPDFQAFMKLCDEIRVMKIRTNAILPMMLQRQGFGAEGIGLFRTEHMFYGKNAEKPLFLLRKMIASTPKLKEEKRWMNSSRL